MVLEDVLVGLFKVLQVGGGAGEGEDGGRELCREVGVGKIANRARVSIEP